MFRLPGRFLRVAVNRSNRAACLPVSVTAPERCQQFCLAGLQVRELFRGFQTFDVGMAADDPGGAARRVQQDAVEQAAVPPGLRPGGVCFESRLRQASA